MRDTCIRRSSRALYARLPRGANVLDNTRVHDACIVRLAKIDRDPRPGAARGIPDLDEAGRAVAEDGIGVVAQDKPNQAAGLVEAVRPPAPIQDFSLATLYLAIVGERAGVAAVTGRPNVRDARGTVGLHVELSDFAQVVPARPGVGPPSCVHRRFDRPPVEEHPGVDWV